MLNDNLTNSENATDNHRDERPIWWVGIVIVVLFGGLCIWILTTRYQMLYKAEDARLSYLAQVYDENLLLLMSNIDSIMLTTHDKYKLTQDSEELNVFVHAVAQQLPQLRTLLIMDANGDTIADSRADRPAIGINVRDRAYFIAHTGEPNNKLYIDQPVESRVDGNWSLPLSRGVWLDNGEFLGVIVGSIDPTFFSGLPANLNNERLISGYVVFEDGTIHTSIPYDPEVIGLSITDDRIGLSLEQTPMTGKNTVITESHLVTYLENTFYPYSIIFTENRHIILRTFFNELLLILMAFLIVSLVTFFVLRQQILHIRQISQHAKLLRQSEQKAVQERNLLRTLIDNLPDYIYVKDRSGRYQEVNNAVLTYTNLDRDALLQRTSLEVFGPSRGKTFHETDLQVINEGIAIINQEITLFDRDGNELLMLLTKLPIKDMDNNDIGLVGVTRDITELRKAQLEKQEAERMREEMKRKQEVLEMKQRFITMASHDFRTPLAIIKSSSYMLMEYFEKYTNNQRASRIQRIIEQVDHMTAMMDHVLTLSKINDGRIQPQYSDVDIETFCNEIWQDLTQNDNGQHRIEILNTVSINSMQTDRQLLRYVLTNVIVNAFKYTSKDKLVSFKIYNENDIVTFLISDEGRGIPETDMEHLFEPFYRSSNVTDNEGTGLGLAITKEYIELLKGNIEVFSTLNVGTSFKINLPIKIPN